VEQTTLALQYLSPSLEVHVEVEVEQQQLLLYRHSLLNLHQHEVEQIHHLQLHLSFHWPLMKTVPPSNWLAESPTVLMRHLVRLLMQVEQLRLLPLLVRLLPLLPPQLLMDLVLVIDGE
jgi:hypothetical protein